MSSDDDELYLAALDSFEQRAGPPAPSHHQQPASNRPGAVALPPKPLRAANGSGGLVGGPHVPLPVAPAPAACQPLRQPAPASATGNVRHLFVAHRQQPVAAEPQHPAQPHPCSHTVWPAPPSRGLPAVSNVVAAAPAAPACQPARPVLRGGSSAHQAMITRGGPPQQAAWVQHSAQVLHPAPQQRWQRQQQQDPAMAAGQSTALDGLAVGSHAVHTNARLASEQQQHAEAALPLAQQQRQQQATGVDSHVGPQQPGGAGDAAAGGQREMAQSLPAAGGSNWGSIASVGAQDCIQQQQQQQQQAPAPASCAQQDCSSEAADSAAGKTAGDCRQQFRYPPAAEARAATAEPAAAAASQQPSRAQLQQTEAAALPSEASEAAAVAQATTAAPAAAEPAASAAPESRPDAPPAARRGRLRQLFDYLVVYDLEATCSADKANQPQPQEIIELSCVIVDTASLQLLASFQRYVKPDQHPLLTEFCTELTGITQAMVDGGIPLASALQQHTEWLREQGLIGKGKTFVPVTWRDWDLKVMMAMECKWRRIEVDHLCAAQHIRLKMPKFMRRWVDISAVWVKHSNKKGNLRASVEAAGLAWEGRAHSAIDDARNTARLAVKLMQSGVILGVTGSFSGVDASGRFKQPTLFAAVGSGKASGTGGGGGGQQQQPARKKQRVFDDAGVWSGCCYCGAKAKKRQVKKPGPTNGKWFWSCGRFTMTGGAQCDFFKFEDEVAAPAGRSGKKAR